MYNLGTGKGTSVLEMVAAFEKASGKVYFLYNLLIFNSDLTKQKTENKHSLRPSKV